jgi:hypothetical protein
VDPRLHHLQGKAKRVKSTELLEGLREFYRDKLAMRERHFSAAQSVSDYDFNNTYQYVIAREDVQLNWLRDAITGMGSQIEDLPERNDPGVAGVTRQLTKDKSDAHSQARVLEADRDGARTFVEKWRPRIESMPNARHRSMLRIIIGETIEHQRFFEQAIAGRKDLLGRRADGAGTGGGVLGNRWVEQ